MIGTAWHNGRGTYGIKLKMQDRIDFIERAWESVFLDLEGGPASIEVITAQGHHYTHN